MYLVWSLLCAHFLADFTLQTNALAEWKSRNILGVFVHSIIFFILSLLLSFKYISEIWLYIILLWIVHFIIDLTRVVLIKKTVIKDTIFFFLLDQALHIAGIIILYEMKFVNMILEPASAWMMILSVLIIGTNFITIFLYYAELLIYGDSNIELREKYFGILERMLFIGCFILPGAWWLLFFCVGAVRWYIYKHSLMSLNFRVVNVLGSAVSAVVVGMFFRMFLL